ncbi:SoxR reducing system RseC family protein [Photobacterium lipolyticum]|uniref:Transcriptional regulator n=1 Tax=Photobacterium lipolyticum TaxID=266810 RepID=A0A2T3MXU2_9GAMM|nr:SoxR reducing system RseC family protein [Photobacterium lipolyticum]PSW04700.1 transcriptional regulator [Photobacterium lipolyticum]
MMNTLATVVAVEPGRITVSCQQQTSCGHCGSRDSCGTGIVSEAVPERAHQVKITTKKSLTVGQVVEIGLSEQSILNSALLVYVVPLLFLLLGAALGQWWFVELAGTSEVGVVLTAGVSAGIGLLIARYYATRLEGNSAYEPSLIRVLGQPLSVDKMINAASKDSE